VAKSKRGEQDDHPSPDGSNKPCDNVTDGISIPFRIRITETGCEEYQATLIVAERRRKDEFTRLPIKMTQSETILAEVEISVLRQRCRGKNC
jgi:hypothetical protein